VSASRAPWSGRPRLADSSLRANHQRLHLVDQGGRVGHGRRESACGEAHQRSKGLDVVVQTFYLVGQPVHGVRRKEHQDLVEDLWVDHQDLFDETLHSVWIWGAEPIAGRLDDKIPDSVEASRLPSPKLAVRREECVSRALEHRSYRCKQRTTGGTVSHLAEDDLDHGFLFWGAGRPEPSLFRTASRTRRTVAG
jgi:hypothetical protein